MKNKLIKLGCLVLGALFSFASCGENGGQGKDSGQCTHTFSQEWTSNATHHWHAATCEHGEQQDAKAEHIDADEDSACDVCAYSVGHTHTFEETWQYDEDNHWKLPTCSHTEEKGELNKHSDEDTDGVCDECGSHVHTINTYGFCSGCDKETKPVDENALGSVVYATAARRNHIVSGAVDYKFEGRNNSENTIDTMQHSVEYTYGTNGVYMKRVEGDETQEDWIKPENGEVTGITVISVDGTVTAAQPSSFDTDSLLGYYFAVSTFADGYSAENVLKTLYERSQEASVLTDTFQVEHDKENKKYSFSFDSLIVNELSAEDRINGGETTVYNVNLFEVAVDFTYNDDYALTSLNIKCDCYTNDPGSSMEGLLEADVDLDYDPVTKTHTKRETAAADTYTFQVAQKEGERAEIALNDGSEYAPTDFDVKYEGADVTTLDLDVGKFTTLNIIGKPEDRFMSFIQNNMVVSVTDAEGNIVNGFANLQGAEELQIWPNNAGEYTVTLTYGEIVKTIKVTVTGTPLGGTERFEVLSTDNNAWNQIYEFKAEKNGTYTFYLPYGVGVAEFTEVDRDGYPIFEDSDIKFDYNRLGAESQEGKVSFSVILRQGQTYKLCFMFRTKGVSYTIGYDAP